MLSSIKHITAILLLVIFPVSAIGVDVTVHSCQQKGKTLLSLHSIDSKAGMTCCCSHGSKMGSCCHMNHKKKNNSSASQTLNSIASTKSTHFCCSKTKKSGRSEKKAANSTDEQSYSSDESFAGLNKQHDKAGAQLKSLTCCSQSDVCYSVNVVSVSLESADKLLITPILVPEILPGFSSLSQHLIYNSDKIQNYPLKEPVCHIISFIYLNSNSGDDTDLPHTQSC